MVGYFFGGVVGWGLAIGCEGRGVCSKEKPVMQKPQEYKPETKQTDKQNRQTDRQTDRKASSRPDRQTDRQRDKQADLRCKRRPVSGRTRLELHTDLQVPVHYVMLVNVIDTV